MFRGFLFYFSFSKPKPMQVLENPANERMIAKTLGKPYSLMQKVKLKGTGSAKFIYLKGIEAFEPIKALNGDLDYVNFELYPKGSFSTIPKEIPNEA